MRLVLGAIPFGSTVDDETSFAILDRFVEGGGRVIDTANNYPFWVDGCTGDENELAIGRWMKSRKNRDDIEISTKVGARPTIAGDKTLDSAEGLSARTIREAVEGSLKRLGTDHIDVYWAHIEDRQTPLEETLGAFHELTEQGKVREIGASNLPAWRLERARSVSAAAGWSAYGHVQLRYSYVRPRPGAKLRDAGHQLVSDEMLDYVRSEPDLTLWAYNTLMAGGYVRKDKPIDPAYDHPGTTQRLAVLDEVSRELDATPNQVVLAWLMNGDPAVRPIVGATSVEQIEESLGAANLELSADVTARLDEVW